MIVEVAASSLLEHRLLHANQRSSMHIPGLVAALQALVRPGLVVPNLKVSCMCYVLTIAIRRLDWQRIYAAGARYIVFDKDNCLTKPHQDTLSPALKEAWDECRSVFGSENMLLVSNSAGSSSDPQALAAEIVSSNLGVPVLCHATKKPGTSCARQVVDHFESLVLRKADATHTQPLHIVVIGDRITSDMVFAQRIARLIPSNSYLQCTSILTTQLWGRENFGVRCMRTFESSILRALVRIGIPPGGTWHNRGYDSSAFSSWVKLEGKAQLSTDPSRRAQIEAGVKNGWLAMTKEVFGSVEQVREQTWSVLSGAPVKQWRPSWRLPQVSQKRRITTTRALYVDHKKWAPKRPLPHGTPDKLELSRSWSLFGIPWTRWALALIALIILPIGFMAGMRLNDYVDRWRLGDLSQEGDTALPPTPEQQKVVNDELTAESLTEQCKKITSLELKHHHLRRERERISEKLAYLSDRQQIRTQ